MVKQLLSGNHAAAHACKGADVRVIAAYPITPQSPVVEAISAFVEGGEMPKAQFITVESEQTAITVINRIFAYCPSHRSPFRSKACSEEY